MKTGCEMGLEDAKHNIAAIQELGGGKVLVLVDMRGVRSQPREARQYFSGPEAPRVHERRRSHAARHAIPRA
jgi:hypothetical protein